MGLLGNILEPNPQGGLLDLAMNLAIAGGSGAPTMAGLAQAGQATRQNMLQARAYQQEQDQYQRKLRLQQLEDKAARELTDQDLKDAYDIGGPEGYVQILASKLRGRYGGENTPDMVQEYQFALQNGFKGSYTDWVKFRRENLQAPIIMQTPSGPIALQTGTQGSTRTTSLPNLPVAQDPNVQRNVTYGETTGRETAEADTSAIAGLDGAVTMAQQGLEAITRLKNNSEGRQWITGTSSVLPVVPGTKAADAMSDFGQIKGQNFLAAYNQLKGAGAITNIEGEKGEAAITRLQRAQSEEDFVSALDDLGTVISNGITRARSRAAQAQQRRDNGGSPPPKQPMAPAIGKTIRRTGTTADGRRVVEYTDGTREFQ